MGERNIGSLYQGHTHTPPAPVRVHIRLPPALANKHFSFGPFSPHLIRSLDHLHREVGFDIDVLQLGVHELEAMRCYTTSHAYPPHLGQALRAKTSRLLQIMAHPQTASDNGPSPDCIRYGPSPDCLRLWPIPRLLQIMAHPQIASNYGPSPDCFT